MLCCGSNDNKPVSNEKQRQSYQNGADVITQQPQRHNPVPASANLGGRRLGTKSDYNSEDNNNKEVQTASKGSPLSPLIKKPEPAHTKNRINGGDSVDLPREKAARAAEERRNKMQQQQGPLGRKLAADKKKSHKDYALASYVDSTSQ